MKQFMGFVRKEMYHILRDQRTLLVLFGMPLAMLIVFGYVITNEINNARIGVLDLSKDNTTREITEKLTATGYLKLVTHLKSEDEVNELFRQGAVKEVVVFEPGFARKLQSEGTAKIRIITDASDANFANILAGYTTNMINQYNRSMIGQMQSPMQIVPEIRMYYNPDLRGVFMFVPGIMALVLILISALMTSVSIVREKELGTMEVLLVSPLKPFQIIIGKVIPYVVLAFADALLIILMANLVFGLPVKGSLLLLLAESLLFIILSLSLGILISTANDTQQNAMMIALLALMLPTLLLSGFIYPIENMPVWLQVICQINPAKWYIDILKVIMVKGLGWAFVWKQTLILIGTTAILLLASARKFKIRLE